MNTKPLLLSRILTLAATLLLATAVSAQSLGDIAREQRAKRAPAQAKPTRVYTNDNLPREGGLSTTEVEIAKGKGEKGKEGEKGKDGEKGKEGEKAKAGEKEEDKKNAAEEEKAYREKFSKLRDNVVLEEKKLDVAQRELNLANVQFYSNPDQALREQNTRGELNNRQADLEKQKAAVEAARRAIADLEEEVRRRGLPPGWAR